MTKCLSLLKTKLKNVRKEGYFVPTNTVEICLKSFAIQLEIKGLNGYDPELFLLNFKPPITNLIINTQQTKVKLILLCMMEKVDLKSGEVIAKEAEFHSKTDVNLESTNSKEWFSKMKEAVLESLAKFQSQGSNGRFHSVLSLDLHTAKYEPLGGSSYVPLQKFLAAKKR